MAHLSDSGYYQGEVVDITNFTRKVEAGLTSNTFCVTCMVCFFHVNEMILSFYYNVKIKYTIYSIIDL